jgi:S1-C subfamily serine protease
MLARRSRGLLISLVFMALLLLLSGCCPLPLPTARNNPRRTPTKAIARATASPVEPIEATATAGASPQTEAATPTRLAKAAPTAEAVVVPVGEEERLLEELYQRVNPSVVNIVVTLKVASDSVPDSDPNAPGLPQRGEGSGFVYDDEGHIITNNHVVANAEDVLVTFADDVSLAAQIVGTDPDSDLAVIKVDPTGLVLKPLALGDSGAIRVGQRVIAIGNPFGLQGTMTTGIVSALGRLLPVGGSSATGRYNIPDVIQTDAAINPGNSGGPLLNLAGQVVGVNAAIESPVRGNAGVGFAIPAAIVQKVVPVLITKGSYDHPWLGISTLPLSPAMKKAMKLAADQRGVLVVAVLAGSPAEKAGLRASADTIQDQGGAVPVGGDVIVGIDDIPVNKFDDLISYLGRETEVGQTVRVQVLRDGRAQVVEVTLAARPKSQTQ